MWGDMHIRIVDSLMLVVSCKMHSHKLDEPTDPQHFWYNQSSYLCKDMKQLKHQYTNNNLALACDTGILCRHSSCRNRSFSCWIF
jgi:hypothetical protein